MMPAKRISQIDGLKGIAILSVILSHLPLQIIHVSAPPLFKPFVTILLGSGGIGVYVFFLLTGFLMAYLYPHPLPACSFWMRRYLRILPQFFVMVISYTIISLVPLPWWVEIAAVVIITVLIRIFWNVCIYVRRWIPIGKLLFYSWIFIQISVACWYVFYLLRIPPSIYYQVWDLRIRWIVTGIINITLTLPFGQYVAQIDGVYWALVAELFFYLAYPVVIVPLFQSVGKFAPFFMRKILAISLFPFCFGLYLIGERILRFSIIQPHLAIYFLFGIIIGRYYLKRKKQLHSIAKVACHPAVLLPSIGMLFGSIFIADKIPHYYYPWLQMSIVLPVSIVLISSFGVKTILHKVLSNPYLSALGIYSYSLFITHSFVIHIITRVLPFTTVGSAVISSVVVFFGSVMLAIFLHHMLEKPYSLIRKVPTSQIGRTFLNVSERKFSIQSFSKPLLGISLAYLLLLYVAYKPPLSVFTTVQRVDSPSPFQALFGESTDVVRSDPQKFSFQGLGQNLGMILLHVRNISIPDVADPMNTVVQFIVRLRDEKNHLISQHSYATSEIIDSYYHPFGFPVQGNSEELQYFLEYQLSRNSPSQRIELVTTEGKFLPVYFPDKTMLLKHPSVGVLWFIYKIAEPFQNPLLWVTFLFTFPFLGGVWIVLLNGRSK